VLSEAWATVEDSDDLDTFTPHVVHKPHEPFPIAMCCRKPHGCELFAPLGSIVADNVDSPWSSRYVLLRDLYERWTDVWLDIRNPQNAAWLAGFRYAKKNIFMYVLAAQLLAP
jgi:hypothetical protein